MFFDLFDGKVRPLRLREKLTDAGGAVAERGVDARAGA